VTQFASLRRTDGVVLQLSSAVVLGAGAWLVAAPSGSWLGIDATAWFAAALVVPVAHQLYVWAVWRAELFDRSWTRRFGDRALRVFGAGFFVLFGLRPITVAGVAIADRGTLYAPGPASWIAAGVLAAPAIWTFVSVQRWFGP
jgi:hypothetical protein